MLLDALLFLAVSIVTTTLAMILPGAARSRIWVALPLGLLALAASAALVTAVAADLSALPWLIALGVAGAGVTRLLLRRWSWLAAQLFAAALLGTLAYIAYSLVVTFGEGLGPVGVVASLLLLVLEVAALAMSLSYAF